MVSLRILHSLLEHVILGRGHGGKDRFVVKLGFPKYFVPFPSIPSPYSIIVSAFLSLIPFLLLLLGWLAEPFLLSLPPIPFPPPPPFTFSQKPNSSSEGGELNTLNPWQTCTPLCLWRLHRGREAGREGVKVKGRLLQGCLHHRKY